MKPIYFIAAITLNAGPIECAAQATGAQQPDRQAKLWSCHNGETDRLTITDAPSRLAVQTEKSGCKILDLSGSTFMRIPAERFHAMGSDLGGSDLGLSNLTSAGNVNRPGKGGDRLILNRSAGMKPTTSFNAKDVTGTGGRGRRTYDQNTFDRGCEISGIARSEESTDALVRIRRGALTVDDVPVKLGGHGKPVKWRTKVPGVCRNPEVTVIVER